MAAAPCADRASSVNQRERKSVAPCEVGTELIQRPQSENCCSIFPARRLAMMTAPEAAIALHYNGKPTYARSLGGVRARLAAAILQWSSRRYAGPTTAILTKR